MAVTNFETRHVAVTASAIASLSDFSNGRLRVAFGTGDSSVKLLGLEPTRHQPMRGQVGILRHYRRGGCLAGHSGNTGTRVPAPAPASRSRADLCKAGSGPKSQQEQGPEIFARITRHVTT